MTAPTQEIAPGISKEALGRLSPELSTVIGNYFPVFFKKDAWNSEWGLVRKSSTALQIFNEGQEKRQTDHRWQAVFVVVLEKRLGKPINPATAAQYAPVITSIKQIADTIGSSKGNNYEFLQTNNSLNIATFIECCLDRMGVAEAKKPAMPFNAVMATDYAGMNLSALDPKINHPIIDHLKAIAIGPQEEKDMKEIAQSNRAIRLFIGENQNRLLALTVIYFEKLVGGDLRPEELAFARKVYHSLNDLFRQSGFQSEETNISCVDFISIALFQVFRYETKQRVRKVPENQLVNLTLKPETTGGTFWFNDIQYRVLRRSTSSGTQFVLVTVLKEKGLIYDKESERFLYKIYTPLQSGLEYKIPRGDSPLSVRLTDNDELAVFNTDKYQQFFFDANDFSQNITRFTI